ncbi:unnamed protein product [Lota lota]
MEQEVYAPQQNTFTCVLCGLSTPFTYFGQKPPNTRAIVLLEECFVTRDPFSPDKERFLVLGSKCSLCGSCACVGSDCSLFYTTRFCMRCVNKNLEQFPAAIQSEVAKKPTSKPAVP